MQEFITSKDNPNIKLYQKLSANKKYRTEYGMFPLEGLRLISDAVMENAELHCVLMTESFMKKQSVHGDALDFPSVNGRRILCISDELGAKLASTEGTQGIFAICRMKAAVPADTLAQKGGRYVMLHNIQDPGNLGTIIRTADAMGIDGVFAVNCCDIYSPKAVRSTMGSLFRMKICLCSEEDAFAAFDKNGIASYAAVIDSDAVSVTDVSFGGNSVVLIGNEGNGLPQEVSDRCTERITIKMHGNINSLNAATAASIIMWELTK